MEITVDVIVPSCTMISSSSPVQLQMLEQRVQGSSYPCGRHGIPIGAMKTEKGSSPSNDILRCLAEYQRYERIIWNCHYFCVVALARML